jgi:multidrug efflux system membrane fusion protein
MRKRHVRRAPRLTRAWVCALIFGASLGCGGEPVDLAPHIRPVRYQPVYATGGSRVRSFSGVAEAGIESKLSFKVAGSIETLAVKLGDSVRAGQLIAELDATDHQLQVQQSQASLTQSEAQARRAAADYERTRSLYESRNASKNDLDQARSASESADAQMESSAKALELAQQRLSYCRLLAPISGAIAEVPVEANENVQVGQRIATMTSGDRMEVSVGVPEILIAQIREGDAVSVQFDALPNTKLGGRVSEVGVAAMGAVTTFPVTILLDERTRDVRPGMAASVAFTFTSADNRERFLVPPVAVGEDRNGRYLYVAKPTGSGMATVERREVTVGELTGEGLEVLEGLFEGDFLVTAGVSKLVDGQIVRLPAGEDEAS